MGYFWSKPEPVVVDYESEPESEMDNDYETTRQERAAYWRRYHTVKKQLEARGAKTFGSLERMEQRLERFLDMETQQAEKAARKERERARIEAAPVTPPQSPRSPVLPPLLRRQNARQSNEVYTDEEFMIDQINENWIHFMNTNAWNRPDALADMAVSIYALQTFYERARDVQQQIMTS